MSEAKHTEGEWIADIAKYPDGEVFGFAITVDGKDVFVASAGVATPPKALVLAKAFRHLEFAEPFFTPEELEANARLIAAAPSLLEFAQDIASNYDCDQDAHRYDTRCRKCCAKEVILQATEQTQ